MKKLNLGDGLTLIAEINKNDKMLTISVNDKKSKTNSVLNNYYINTCETCGDKFISKEKLQFCPSCFVKVVNFASKISKNAEKPTVIDSPKSSFDNKINKARKHKKHIVTYYGKSVLADNNIIIDNLPELHNLVGDYITKARLETWLRFAIMGLSYEQIAKKLAVKTESVKVEYNFFGRRGIIKPEGNRPYVSSIVKYHIASEDTARVDIIREVNELNPATRTAYLFLKDDLKDWTNYEALSRKHKCARHTLVSYMYELNRAGLIEKRKINNVRSFRFKR